MSTDEVEISSQEYLLQKLREIHRTKSEILREICQLKVSDVPIVNCIRSDFHCIKYMTRSLGEIIHSLHPEYEIKTRRRLNKHLDESGWIWAP